MRRPLSFLFTIGLVLRTTTGFATTSPRSWGANPTAENVPIVAPKMDQTILSNCHDGTLGTNANIMLNPQDANGNAVQANVYIKQNGTCIEWTFENYADGYVVAYWKTNNPPPNGQVYYSSGS